MQRGNTADIIRCLGCVSHLSIAQTVQLEMKLGEEAFSLIQKGQWRIARDLLGAAEIVGVSSLRNAKGEQTVGSMIEETYALEAMDDEFTDADSVMPPILWPSVTLKNMMHKEEEKLESRSSISRVSTAASMVSRVSPAASEGSTGSTVFENDSAAAC
jgi:hypothetical protein